MGRPHAQGARAAHRMLVLWLILLVLVPGIATAAGPPRESEFQTAVAQLGDPRNCCRSAATLTRLQDPGAVIPLLTAYELRREGDKLCLLEALAALDAPAVARQLATRPDAEDRRRAAHLLELCGRENQLPLMLALCADTDERVRRQALTAISTQKRTRAWEAAMLHLLASAHLEVRERAVRNLSRRITPRVREALQERLVAEIDGPLKETLREILSR